jgi:hypothetical protein
MSIVFGYGHELGIAAVYIPACCTKLTAEVLLSAQTERADSAGGKDPPHPYPLSAMKPLNTFTKADDFTDHLMAKHYRQMWGRGSALYLIELGMAYPTGLDSDKDLSFLRDRVREDGRFEGFVCF